MIIYISIDKKGQQHGYSGKNITEFKGWLFLNISVFHQHIFKILQ